jgi:HNH endonuclease
MRRKEHQALRERYVFRCGYCGISEADAGALLTTDHFQPRSRGGSDEPDNLVYSCHACNEFKGEYWQPESVERILHPLLDDLSNHLAERPDGRLQPLTETGAFHIETLRLNRPGLVAHRLERQLTVGVRQVQSEMAPRLSRVEERVQRLAEEVERLAQRNIPRE